MSSVFLTDEIRDIVAVGESAGGSVGRVVDAVRVGIGSCRGGQVIVVTVVDERVAEHEESSSLGSGESQHR